MSLPRSFWINGFLLTALAHVTIGVTVELVRNPLVVIGLLMVDLVVVVWQVVGLWRAATYYTGPFWFAFIVKILVVFGWIKLAAYMLLLL